MILLLLAACTADPTVDASGPADPAAVAESPAAAAGSTAAGPVGPPDPGPLTPEAPAADAAPPEAPAPITVIPSNGHPAAIVIGLDGRWRTPTSGAIIPAYGQIPPGPYTRDIDVPAAWAGGRAELVFPTTGWRVHVTLDGVEVGTDIGGLWPARVAIPGGLPKGRHTLGFSVEAATPDNIEPGTPRTPVNGWTYAIPPAGEAIVRGPTRLELTPGPAFSHADARLVEVGGGFRVEASAWTLGVAPGTRVKLRLVRDGATVATLPDATVDATGLARSTAPWKGPRWPDADALMWLVADAGDGVQTQVRVGPRSTVPDDRELRINGERTYLAAVRLSGAAFSGRKALANALRQLPKYGGNAVELHGEPIPPFVYEAADELGLPVVLTPRCDGRCRLQGPVTDSPGRRAFVNAGDARARDALRHHPSIVLWTLEAQPLLDGAENHPQLEVDGLPVIPERLNVTLGDPSLEQRGGPPGWAPFYGELPWTPFDAQGKSSAARLAPLLTTHVRDGMGLVLPFVSPEADGADRALAELAALTGKLGIPVFVPDERRGVSTLKVQVSRAGAGVEGVPIVVELPGQLPIGGLTDHGGVAWIEAYYAGPATVRIAGTDLAAPVELRAGRWSDASWTPTVAKADLTLDAPQ